MKHAHSQTTNATQFVRVFFNSLLWQDGPRRRSFVHIVNFMLIPLWTHVTQHTRINSWFLFEGVLCSAYSIFYLHYIGDESEHSKSALIFLVIESMEIESRAWQYRIPTRSHINIWQMKFDQLIHRIYYCWIFCWIDQFSHIEYPLLQLALWLLPSRQYASCNSTWTPEHQARLERLEYHIILWIYNSPSKFLYIFNLIISLALVKF